MTVENAFIIFIPAAEEERVGSRFRSGHVCPFVGRNSHRSSEIPHRLQRESAEHQGTSSPNRSGHPGAGQGQRTGTLHIYMKVAQKCLHSSRNPDSMNMQIR